jgi:hypothetical protein
MFKGGEATQLRSKTAYGTERRTPTENVTAPGA